MSGEDNTNQTAIHERLNIGETAWISASLTQLMFTPPPEYNVSSFGGKLAYLPVTVKSIDGDSAVYTLEWSSAVNIKCKQDEAMRRIVDPPLDLVQLSKLPVLNDGMVTDFLWSRYRLGELNNYCGSVAICINPLLFTGTSARASYIHNADICLLHAQALRPSGALASPPSFASIAGNLIRSLKETCFPQTFLPRGQSGSGKSEACKEALQVVLFADSTRKDYAENRPLPHYEALGSYRNPFYIPSDSVIGNNIAAGIAFMDAFGTAPTERSPLSTRFIRLTRVNYHMGDAVLARVAGSSDHSSSNHAHTGGLNDSSSDPSLAIGAVAGVDYFLLPMEPCRVGYKDQHCRPYTIFYMLASTFAESGLHHVSSTLRDNILSDATHVTIEQLQQQFEHLSASLIAAGISTEFWESCIAALCACLHLQQVTLVGADTAIISAGTKNAVPFCEEALGLEVGTVSELILKKSEEKMGRTVTSDNKLPDAKNVVDGLVGEIYRRVCEHLSIQLSENSYAHCGAATAKLAGIVPFNIVDVPGWENVDGNACNGYSQMVSNYIEERMSIQFAEHVFHKEIRRLEEENIVMPSISIPDNTPLVELFEKPVSGIIALLDETCQFPRGDDKTFTEKTISTHVKTKLVRSGGAKAKQVTAFVVKHNFGEIVYDSVTFIQTSKVRLPANVLAALSNSPLACLSQHPATCVNRLGSMDITDKITTRYTAPPATPTHVAPSTPAGDSGTATGARPAPGRLGGASGGGAGASLASKQTFTFSRCRDSLNKFLKAMDETSLVTHVLCVRPHIDPNSRVFNPDYVARQLKQLNVVEIARFRKLGYSYSSRYNEYYSRFRIIAPFFHPKLPHAVTATTSRKDTELLTKSLLKICFDELQMLPAQTVIGVMIPRSIEAAVDSGDLVFGLTRLFLREDLVDAFEQLRHTKHHRVAQGALLVQAVCRMMIRRSKYLSLKQATLALQSLQRMRSNRRLFLQKRASANLLKATFRMHVDYGRYQELKSAVEVIKSRLLAGMLYRVRFVRMQRALRMAQSLARSFIIRNMAAKVNHALTVLHSAGRDFVRRNRLFYLRKHSAIHLQRVFRGWVFREHNAALAYALKVRRNQRIVKVIIRKLQGRWRGKLVRKRFHAVVSATMILQRWCRARLQRYWFLAVLMVNQFLQKHARRLMAVARVDILRLNALMKEEREILRKTRQSELSLVQVPLPAMLTSNVSSDAVRRPIDLVIGAGAIKNNLASEMYTRRIIGFDISSTSHAVSYPEPCTWLSTITNFANQLKQDNKKSLVTFAVGTTHTICVDNKFDVYSLGLGDNGQLGHNNRKNVTRAPAKIAAMSQTVAVAETAYLKTTAAGSKLIREAGFLVTVLNVCCGKDFTLILLSSHRIYSWGSNKRGQLGHSGTAVCPYPKPLEGAYNRNIKSISCGWYHCAAVSEQGALYTWGAGYGLGRVRDEALRGDGSSLRLASMSLKAATILPDSAPASDAWQQEDCSEMNPLPFFLKRKVRAIACGEQHVLVRSSSELLAWGMNTNGQLGDGYSLHRQLPVPIRLPISPTEADLESALIVASSKHSGLVLKGDIYMWGCNKHGQLGLYHTDDVLSPQKVILPSSDSTVITCRTLATGYQCTVALSHTNQLYAWGSLCLFPAYNAPSLANIYDSSSVPSAAARTLELAGGVTMLTNTLDLSSTSAAGAPNASSKTSSAQSAKTPPVTLQPLALAAPTSILLSNRAYGYIHNIHVFSSSTVTVVAVDTVLPFGQQPASTNASKFESTRKVEPFSPQNVIEARRAAGILQVDTQAEIQSKLKEKFHSGNSKGRTGAPAPSISSQVSVSSNNSQKPTRNSSKLAGNNNASRSQSPAAFQLEVDSDKLLDIFSPFRDRSQQSIAAAYMHDFDVFNEKLQQRQSQPSQPQSQQAVAPSPMKQPSASTSNPHLSSLLSLAPKPPSRNPSNSSIVVASASSTASAPANKQSSKAGGVGMPHADKLLLTKFASKKMGAGGNESGGGAEAIIIPALGIGVDTAMRNTLIVQGVKSNESKPADEFNSPASLSPASTASGTVSRSKKPSYSSRNSIIGIGSPASTSAAVNPDRAPTISGATSRTPFASKPDAILSPLQAAVSNSATVTPGRRASMPGLRPGQAAGTSPRGASGGAVVDVKDILSGLGPNQHGKHKSGKARGPASRAVVENDDDLDSEMEELKRELHSRQQVLRHQQHQGHGHGHHAHHAAPAAGGGPTSIVTPFTGGSSTIRKGSGSGIFDTSSDAISLSSHDTIDMTKVRDLSTMLQNIKKETIVNMTGAWKQ